VVHPQDWQFAATSLTVKEAILDGRLRSAAVVLTSHNPYDYGLPAEDLGKITERTADRSGRASERPPWPTRDLLRVSASVIGCPGVHGQSGVCRRIGVAPLQTSYFANHLQEIFARQGLRGVENGPFLKPEVVFSVEEIQQARRGIRNRFSSRKRLLRQEMLDTWTVNPPGSHRISGRRQGRKLRELPDAVPIFMMFGRLDPRQKGFDVMARAIEGLERVWPDLCWQPTPGGLPIVPGGSARLAQSRPGDVVCFTQRMEQATRRHAGGGLLRHALDVRTVWRHDGTLSPGNTGRRSCHRRAVAPSGRYRPRPAARHGDPDSEDYRQALCRNRGCCGAS